MSHDDWLELVRGSIVGLLGIALSIASTAVGVYLGLWMYGVPHV